ncbi:MAG: NADH-quinone oxidoreductase subunit N [Deltaproteobacteria bacterium]
MTGTVVPAGMGELAALGPVVWASLWAMLVLVVEAVRRDSSWRGMGWLSLIGLGLGMAIAGLYSGEPQAFSTALVVDSYAIYFNLLLAILTAAAVMMAMDYLPFTGVVAREYYPLVLFAVAGLMIMAAATDLVVMFLGLETMSIAVYALAGLWRGQMRSTEAALKYFLLGAFASAILVYGIALIYAETGSTVLVGVAEGISGGADAGVLMAGVAMLMVGFGFKVAAVPFHLWTPDVYEGSPTSVTVFMATVVKAGAFAALLRTLVVALAPLHEQIYPLLAVAAVATMTLGNLAALAQTSLKRMLAYSSIAHTGYLLVGLAAVAAQGATSAVGGVNSVEATGSVLFYLAVYGAMNLGVFGIMMLLARVDYGAEDIDDLAGLSRRHPLLAATMTVFLLSLTGFPPLGGFIGKLYVFAAALDAGLVWLVVVAVVNSVVSAVYYLGVVRAMYFDQGQDGRAVYDGARPYLAVAVAMALVATLALGLFPSGLMEAASGHLAGG